ncbi:unnamed protein product, partial [Adineta ricciae]
MERFMRNMGLGQLTRDMQGGAPA